MIAQLRGKIVGMGDGFVVLDVSGVGYKIHLSPYTAGKVAGQGEEILFYTYTQVREDILALFGFLSLDELSMFELLITVSGVGPKAALGILSIADPNTIRAAVTEKDASILTKVSGIGKKTAEKIIIELQNKVSAPTGTSQTIGDQEALEALLSLGYHVTEAREALKMVPKELKSVNERLREALKNLGKK